MRKMPSGQQSLLNPLDNFQPDGSIRFYKKPFQNVNQHYLSHNIVLPDARAVTDVRNQYGNSESERKSGMRNRSPSSDPYSLLPLKPNQMPEDAHRILKQRVSDSPAAGVGTEWNSASKKIVDPYGNALARAGANLVGQRNSSLPSFNVP